MRSLITISCIYILGLLSCKSSAPVHPDISEIKWKTYKHSQLGYSLEVPDFYEAIPEDQDLFFRFKGHPSLVIHFQSEEEAGKNGLWADYDPVGQEEFAGHDWTKFVYNHQDAFFYMRTVSFVLPYKDQFLSLDIRTDGELDAIHKKILSSFSLSLETGEHEK